MEQAVPIYEMHDTALIQTLVLQAVAVEREKCAQVAESFQGKDSEIAQQIRLRALL